MIISRIGEVFETEVCEKWQVVSPADEVGRAPPRTRSPKRTPGLS
ncbi:hypothetical protein [Methylorubrum aminovorans]|nr:hypothetical protein [Methylorubrum aminovorans]